MKKHPPLTTEHAKEFYEGATLFTNPRIRRVPRFDYQNLPDTEQLSYELLTWDNFKNFLTLFENDPNPFVMKQFKTLDQLEMYAVSQLEYNRYSFKHGACDWFLRSKTSGELIGVLHIYELNWELMNGKHFPCMFGYAIAEPYRRQGFATEAVMHLLNHIPLTFKRFEVLANPEKDNLASRAFLEKLGLKRKTGFVEKKSVFYYKKLAKRIPKKTSQQVWEEEEKYR